MSALVTLLLVICGADSCRIERVPGEITAQVCALFGGHVAATWPLTEGERIVGWRCEAGERA